MEKLKLTYYGHSCFIIESDNISVLFDPYSDNSVPGYKPLDVRADIVVSSHEHDDHCNPRYIDNSETQKIIKMESIEIPHDDANGKLRGMNRISILQIDEFKIVHMGDIGCMPDEQITEKIRNADCLMIPVGGYFTIDAVQANEIIAEAQPSVVIPMHYRTAYAGYPLIDPIDRFESIAVCNKYTNCEYTLQKNGKKEIAVLTALNEVR